MHLWEYDWPGNVRELENLLERMVILSEDGWIRVDNLPRNIRSFISEKKHPAAVAVGENGLDLNSAVEEFENRLIEEALRRTKGNKQAAARLLGLKRTTLVAKLRRRTERRARERWRHGGISDEHRRRYGSCRSGSGGRRRRGFASAAGSSARAKGYSVVLADGGRAAISTLAREEVDVVVLDDDADHGRLRRVLGA